MSKYELIQSVQSGMEKSGTRPNKNDAEKMVDAVVDALITELRMGRDVRLPGLGTLAVVQKGAREARNPRTGEAVQVPARKVVKFRPAKGLI